MLTAVNHMVHNAVETPQKTSGDGALTVAPFEQRSRRDSVSEALQNRRSREGKLTG